MAEETCQDIDVPINASVQKEAAGIASPKGNAATLKTPSRHFFHSDPLKRNTDVKKFAADSDPSIYLGMPDEEVKRRTGFPSEMALLAYIFIVCNGDINLIKKRATSLTWYEEWFLHFEYIWGKSLTRLEDVRKTFGVAKRYIDDVITAKYDIEFRALLSWPLFAFYEEDVAMRSRKDKWKNKYRGMRSIMWDITNLTAYGFTDADLQRLTYNQYHGENCLKGGIFTQTSGWQGTYDLWMGAVSDSDYNRRAGYLQEQEAFQNNDVVGGKVLPFLNIYDKGYRAKWLRGRMGSSRSSNQIGQIVIVISIEMKPLDLRLLHPTEVATRDLSMSAKGQGILVGDWYQISAPSVSTKHGEHGHFSQTLCSNQYCK